MKILHRICAVSLLAIATMTHVWAQTSAQLTVTVTDRTAATIAGAAVRLLSPATGVERPATTGENGVAVYPFVPPGEYRVSVTKEGFKESVREGVRLEVNQSLALEVQLDVGQVTERLTVTESAVQLETNNSSIGQVIETKAIVDLPLNGRNFVQLAILGPGVTGVGFGARGTIMSGTRPDDLRPGSELFANGNREGSNNFLIDGIDNNDRLTLSITLRPSVEAVREFKIQTNMFSADQGRNSGATVNVITKSGSNAWHGSAYEFLRNDYFDAKNFFTRPGARIPAFRQNQFGASLGGRVVRDKLFFFANYEGFKRRQERLFVNSVPQPAMRTGDFSAVRDIYDPFSLRANPDAPTRFSRDPFPGRRIPSTLFDPVMARMIQAYPLPQSTALVNNMNTSPKEAQNWDQGDLRADWNVNERNTVFGRFSRQDTVTTRPSTFPNASIPGFGQPVGLGNEDTFAGDSMLKAYNSGGTWISTLSPSLVMEARFGFQRFDLDFRQEGAAPGAKLGEALGVRGANQGPNSDGIPIFSPAGYTGIGQTRSLPIIRKQDTFHPSVNFTLLRGAHSLRFGGEARRRHVTQYQTNRGNGRFNFARTFTDDPNNTANTGDAMASLLLGVAGTIEQDFTLFVPGMRFTEWGGYLQDDWRVTNRLTLNLGLRYEVDTPIREVDNKIANFDVVTGKIMIAGFNSDEFNNVRMDRNNVAPRFGFAYRWGNKTVIRGGYGIFYNPAGSESVYMRRHRMLPFGPINIVDINQFVANPRRVSDGLPAIPNLDPAFVANNPSGGMLAVNPNFRSGYAQQFNFQIQQQAPWEIIVKAGYVGNLGRQLDNTYEFNQPVPGAGAPAPRRPLNNIAPNVVSATYNVFDGLSNYHSLQLSAERRFTSGFGFLSSYTWAKSIDNVANMFGGADNGPIPQDRRFRNADRALSGFDIAHRFVFSTNYAIPFGKGRKYRLGNPFGNALLGGWDLNAIFTAQGGLPFTPVLATSVSNAGGSRPNRLKSGKLDARSVTRWFDTSFNTPDAAWGVPAVFTFGNSARNALRGPGRVNLDGSLFKDFSPSERWRLQFRAEVFNLTNTPQFDLPNPSIGNPNAGIINAIVGTPRQFQLGLRFSF
jgi:hypothetical protein